MYKYLIMSFLVVSTFIAQASSVINDERIQDQKDCFSSIFTDYDSWRNFMERKRKRQIKSEEDLLKAMSLFDSTFGKNKFNQYKNNLTCRKFKYQVDGNTVNGFVIKPKSTTKKLPVLVYNRGGNGNFGAVVFGSMMHNLFPIANEGFVIIGSQYRGTFTDNIMLDEFGGKDVNDVIELFNYIPSIEGADPQRIGMFGASRGGMQTFLTLKQVKNVKAVATIAGDYDLLQGLTYRPDMEEMYKHRIPSYDKNKIEELEKRSALKWVDDLSPNIPILLIHGTQDKQVSVKSSTDFANALSKNNITHKLVLYQEDDHHLLLNKENANKELVNWFLKFL
ncbi:MAG: S9 family peptidase [Alteromonadaceae bacterium]|nr:S9 family peptidase [Alteromonadaceae bacterium]